MRKPNSLGILKLAVQIGVPNANIFYWEFPRYDYPSYSSGFYLHPNEAGTAVNEDAAGKKRFKRTFAG